MIESVFNDKNLSEPTHTVDESLETVPPGDIPDVLANQTGSQEVEAAEDISTTEVLGLLRVLKEQGVDFEDEDVEHISAMDAEERVYYLFQALQEAGFEDPEAILKEKGILE